MRVANILALGLAIGSAAASTSAHHSFNGEFDNTIAVTLHGVVTSVEMVNPHSFIYLDVKSNGVVERWALEGPGPIQVQRRGLTLNFIKAGDELGVCGYLARRDVPPTRPEPGTAKASRKIQAAVLILPSREKLLWNNYGQRKCELDVHTWLRPVPDPGVSTARAN
jgi:hypothetical protein